MESAIVGLPYVGKTTLFNLLTGGHAATGGFAGAEGGVNVGVAKVPDERVDRLAALFHPKKTTHAEVRYVDVGLARSAGGATPHGVRGDGVSAQKLGELRAAEALVHVVRAFRDPAVPHVDGEVDPARDAAALDLELLVADLSVAERRLERLGPELRAARTGEREAKERESALLERVRTALGAGTPVRDLGLDADEQKLLRGYRLLSEKPELVVVNLDEADLGRAEPILAGVGAALAARQGTAVTAVCAKIEAEIAELAPDDAAAFRRELGLREPPLERIARETYALLGLRSFFTVGPDEVRAWTIPGGTTAQQAAGVIHSDLARGFIRAEVIQWDELLRVGSEAEAKRQGLVRTEGKDYHMREGDVAHVLFSV